MDREVKQRLKWVELYREVGDAGLVCRRCGISRPTLRKWVWRYERGGHAGLEAHSRRPLQSPARKVHWPEEQLILSLRQSRKLGARRLQSELVRLHGLSLSLATIHKVLFRNEVKPLKRIKRKFRYRRYACALPGDRIQMDTCKIAPGRHQYTAIDDCTRYRVLGLYGRRTAGNTLLFLDKLLDEMPFPIQRLQTDRGREFFAYSVQQRLMDWGIKFRPIRAGSPHLNGKVERSQKTDFDEFYASVDVNSEDLEAQLQAWQHYYNWERLHGALDGKTPMDRYLELIHETPLWEDVDAMYDPTRERFQEQHYRVDLAIRELNRSL